MWRVGVTVAVVAAVAARAAGECGAGQWGCRGGGCVSADRYCDGRGDCGDGSDEPAACTPCNRTYGGEAGHEYRIGLGGEVRVPYSCHVTLAAGGGQLGDLVQVTFDEFQVGRWRGGAVPCQDGHVSVAELGRPFTGGAWCGSAPPGATYVSETRTITVSVKLSRVPVEAGFALRLRYRFVPARAAVVRYGPGTDRGRVAPHTYCTRTFDECHRRSCKIQSPNYPGIYPRNVSCYWSVRQRDVPTCKHAMIAVQQPHAHKIQIKRSIEMPSGNKSAPEVVAWGACGADADRLVVYDGDSAAAPVLLEYCGGEAVPRVVGRGDTLLVAFHSAPRAAPPPRRSPLRPLSGFELDVDVVFADSDSLQYARDDSCEFHVKAPEGEDSAAGGRGGRRGVLHAPAHTLPPNYTCTWTFHGRPDDVVWMYFASFSHYSLVTQRREAAADRDLDQSTERVAKEREDGRSVWAQLREMAARGRGPRVKGGGLRQGLGLDMVGECPVVVRVWAGEGGGGGTSWCGAGAICARAAVSSAPRACTPPDGHLSNNSRLSVAVTSRPGTAIHPLSFTLHYEFVDTRLPGDPLPAVLDPPAAPPACARVINTAGVVRSPQNVLWFGRGGATVLRCVYRLDGAEGRVKLRIEEASFGARGGCKTGVDHSGRPACLGEETAPRLRVYDVPWPGVRVETACICDAAGAAGYTLVTSGTAAEVELEAVELRVDEDHRHLYWRGEWERVAGGGCAVRGAAPGGNVQIPAHCPRGVVLVTPRSRRVGLVRVVGEEVTGAGSEVGATGSPCGAVALIVRGTGVSRAVCTGGSREQEVVSRGTAGEVAVVVGGAGLVVRYVQVRTGGEECARPCAGLEGCIDEGVVCDGREDCPHGEDEVGCAGRWGALRGAGGAGAAAGVTGAVLLVALMVVCVRSRRTPHKSPEQGGS